MGGRDAVGDAFVWTAELVWGSEQNSPGKCGRMAEFGGVGPLGDSFSEID